MKRRDFLKGIPAVVGANSLAGCALRDASIGTGRGHVLPSDPDWPSAREWDGLRSQLGGRLIQPISPFANCDAGAESCAELVEQTTNSFYVGDHPALTQSSGWAGAWQSLPSAYAVVAEQASDVAAAVNFARTHRLRLVIKGGGHSYQGTSSAADSLLVWTRRMRSVELLDAFVALGCSDIQSPQSAVSMGAGAMWIDAYDAVTTKGGRFVQGGGCTTVGVAGLIQSGGFGSLSKRFGLAAGGLLQAEVVTADGVVRVANEKHNPDLFWALKGGGGGTFGVVTRVTLRTRELPNSVGAVFGTVKARSDAAYRRLIVRVMTFYARELLNPHWGEQMTFKPDNTLRVGMMYSDLSVAEASALWATFVDSIRSDTDYEVEKEFRFLDVPPQRLWDAGYLEKALPGSIVRDDRAGAQRHHFVWKGDQKQVGQFVHAYKSAWLPASLLGGASRIEALSHALYEASRHWDISLHFNKGLAGAREEELAAARKCATNPVVVDAFALAICGAEGPPAYAGMPGLRPNPGDAQRAAAATSKAMGALTRMIPNYGSYVSESDYFQNGWQRAFWGSNYERLVDVKQKYDPGNLFSVHHGVGSEY
ncbi:MAG: hypothetical protein AMXMBFR59_18740 [Rhodanobacteraceae bacterium]